MIVRMLRVLTAGVLFVFAAGVHAQTQDPKLWYVAIGAGGAWYQDLDLEGAILGDASMDTGFTVNGAFGRYLDNERVVRLEAEAIYDRADFSDIGGAKVSGNLSNVGLMFNLLYSGFLPSLPKPSITGVVSAGWAVEPATWF